MRGCDCRRDLASDGSIMCSLTAIGRVLNSCTLYALSCPLYHQLLTPTKLVLEDCTLGRQRTGEADLRDTSQINAETTAKLSRIFIQSAVIGTSCTGIGWTGLQCVRRDITKKAAKIILCRQQHNFGRPPTSARRLPQLGVPPARSSPRRLPDRAT